MRNTSNKLLVSEDGSSSIQSGMFNVSYHSKYGSINESETVFIKAGFYFQPFRNLELLRILEVGFGTGLNPLLTLSHANRQQQRVEYLGIEAYPIGLPLDAACAVGSAHRRACPRPAAPAGS